MKLLIILFCLGLERFLHTGKFLYRFSWLPWYVSHLQRLLGYTSLWRGMLAPLVIVLPIVIVIALIYYMMGGGIYGGLGKFLLSIIVLLYCLGPGDFYGQTDKLINEGVETAIPIEEITDIYWQAHEQIFAVLFWFAILGPVGAILYRLLSLLVQNKEGAYSSFADAAALLHGIAAWMPARIMGLGYALVGNFIKCFKLWLDYFITGWQNNQKLVESCGRTAQGLELTTQLNTEDLHHAQALIDRILVIFVVAIALFTLGAWFALI